MKYLIPVALLLMLIACEQHSGEATKTNITEAQQQTQSSAIEKEIWARVSNAGLFRVIRSGGVVDSPNTSTGKAISKPVIELIKITDRIPLIKDAHMSLQYRIGNLPIDIHWVELRRVLKHPPMSLPDGTTSTGSDYLKKKQAYLGKVIAYTGYGLNEPYEMVEGDWTFEIWYQGEKLIEQTFTTYWPDEDEIAELLPKMKRKAVPNFVDPNKGKMDPGSSPG